MFDELNEINRRPAPFERCDAADLWTDDHTSRMMLEYHLDGSVDVSSRNTAFLDRSAEWIAGHFSLGAGSSLVDFGCGPGLYASRFARRGIRVTGIDFSKRSIDYARQAAARENLDIDYICSDYLEYEPAGAFDLAVMIMCDFCALGPGQRGRMLDTFRRALKPGGSILLDVYSLKAFDGIEEKALYGRNQMDHFWSAGDYYAFQNTFRYDREKAALDRYTIVEKDRRRVVCNWLQFYSPDSLGRELEERGLSVAEIFSDVAGSEYRPDSPEFAVAAGRV